MSINNKIIFITGGSGFIGRNIIRSLKESGCHVKALARSDKSADIVAKLGAEPVKGDLADTTALYNGMQGADYLIHAAANTDHGSMENTQQEQVNLSGTLNVYEQATKAGIKKAIHISSEAVMLSGEPLVNADETHPIPEKPPGGYSKTKAEAEKIAQDHSTNDRQVIVLRPRFVWGRDDTTALPQLIEAAKSGKLSWIGGGRYLMSTTHITNVVHGLSLALEKGVGGEVYLISDGKPIEFRAFITKLLATKNVAASNTAVPRWLVYSLVKAGEVLSRLTKGRIQGPMSWQEYAVLGVEVTLNIDKARRELGYSHVITREEGLKELVG